MIDRYTHKTQETRVGRTIHKSPRTSYYLKHLFIRRHTCSTFQRDALLDCLAADSVGTRRRIGSSATCLVCYCRPSVRRDHEDGRNQSSCIQQGDILALSSQRRNRRYGTRTDDCFCHISKKNHDAFNRYISRFKFIAPLCCRSRSIPYGTRNWKLEAGSWERGAPLSTSLLFHHQNIFPFFCEAPPYAVLLLWPGARAGQRSAC